MRYRSNVIDAAYFKTCIDKGPQGCLASRSRSLDLDFNLSHTLVGGFFGGIGNRILGCKRGAFSRSLKTEDPCTTPGDDIALPI